MENIIVLNNKTIDYADFKNNRLFDIINLDNLNTTCSYIIKVNNIIYCYNAIYNKKLHIDNNDIILLNEDFYVKINENYYLYLIDNYYSKILSSYIPFKIINTIIKNKYMIIECINKNYILINKYKIVLYRNYEMFDLQECIIFHKENTSLLINDKGVQKKLNNLKTKILIHVLQQYKCINNFINCYISNELQLL